MPDVSAGASELAAFLERSWVPLLAAAVVALLAFQAIRPIVHRVVVGSVERRRADDELAELHVEDARKRVQTLENLISRLLRLGVVLVLALVILSIFDLFPVIAGFGLVAAGLTVAGQDVIRDYLMGLLILAEGQYSEGDVVRIGGVDGVVEEVGLRRTVLRDLSGTVHSVSNGNIRVSSNLTRHYARSIVELTVAFGTDLEQATTVIDDVGRTLAEDPAWAGRLLEPPAVLRVGAFTELGVPLIVGGRVRAADRFEVEGELRRRLLVALRQNSVEIPGVHRLVPAQGPGAAGPGASGPGASGPGAAEGEGI